ncbi:hypothetical protein GCM10010915_02610 [Microbacterium faecale]|uniref:Uncharacterized protein n=1 Tax=Microbacterium faecale TaxID=1804630 RepID=A0A916Y0P2_9MICO|nr:hypothetical protein GCM10010915_02610 [Microbacterium faecale]
MDERLTREDVVSVAGEGYDGDHTVPGLSDRRMPGIVRHSDAATQGRALPCSLRADGSRIVSRTSPRLQTVGIGVAPEK